MAIGKLSRFEKLFGDTIIERGYDYENMGRVTQLSKQSVSTHSTKTKQYVAQVIGSRTYQVKLLLTDLPDNDKVIESMSCQCSYEDNCKHMVATLLKIRKVIKNNQEQDILVIESSEQIDDEIDTVKPIETTPDIDTLLASLNIEELQAFIKQSLLTYPHLVNDLTIWVYQQSATDPNQPRQPIATDENISITNNKNSSCEKVENAPANVMVDTAFEKSLKQKIKTLLNINVEYMNWYEPDFNEQIYQLNILLTQFINQSHHQLVILTQWIDEVCALWDDAPEIDLSEPLDEAFKKIGEIAFEMPDNQPPDWYSPYWYNELTFYRTQLDSKSIAMLHKKGELWHYNTDIEDMGSGYHSERLSFDLFIAKQDWQQAFSVLEKNIKINKIQDYGEFKLPYLIKLKIDLFEHLQQSTNSSDITVKLTNLENKNLAKTLTGKDTFDEAVQSLLDEYDYFPDIRRIKIHKAIQADNLETAITYIYKGMAIAEKNNHAGIVREWQKELNDLLKQQAHDTKGDDTAHQSVLNQLRKTSETLAFSHHDIDKKYYKQWRKTYSDEAWEQVIQAKIKELKKAIANKPLNVDKSYFVTAFNCTYFSQLAQVYIIENQPVKLVELVKTYPNRKYVDRYQEQIAKIDIDWLISFYIQDWQNKIEQVSVRKHYRTLAQDIQELLEELPQGKSRWQKMVEEWQARFSTKPKKPALLDELGKIEWEY